MLIEFDSAGKSLTGPMFCIEALFESSCRLTRAKRPGAWVLVARGLGLKPSPTVAATVAATVTPVRHLSAIKVRLTD